MKVRSHSFVSRMLLTSTVCCCLAPLSGISAPVSSSAKAASYAFADKNDPNAKVFTNSLLGALRKNVKPADIAALPDPAVRRLAEELRAGTYNVHPRVGKYMAYELVDSLSKRLKTSGYSRFENPTGIYFTAGEDALVIMQGAGNEKVELKVHDFGPDGKEKSYILKNGVNVIKMENNGLGYISYYTDDFKNAPQVSVHVAGGKVNGVFDSSKNTNEDWKKLLANTVCEVIDIKGKQVQLIYSVEELRKSCPDKGLELINLYDQIMRYQHEIMGLVKYNKVPRNHILGRVIWRGFMHADGLGAAFHKGTMNSVANPDKIPQEAWGISHEFGHVNQTRPGMMWVSTTEVTNNLFSAWANFKLNPKNMRLEHERINGGDGNMIGGRFNAFLNAAIVNGEQWLCQKGPDKMQGYENGGDHFVKLVPLWQLQLYFMAAKRGNPDFLADIFEKVRNESQDGKSNGRLQLDFMKNVCDATKQDLTEFFTKTGMLKPIDKDMDDYRRAQLTITAEECKELADYAKKYRKPDSPVIYYISVNSLDAYAKKLPVTGKENEGVSGDGNSRIVSHDVWKNVAVFETYKGDDLVRVTMVGTDSPDNSSTRVVFPEGSTRIMAVSWDGKRLPVYTAGK